MFTIYSNGNRTAYGIKHYDLDTINDLEVLKKRKDIVPGSTVFVIESSKYYKLNSKKQWIEIFPYASVQINAPGEDDDPNYDGGSIDGTSPDDESIPSYDGGSIDGSDPV